MCLVLNSNLVYVILVIPSCIPLETRKVTKGSDQSKGLTEAGKIEKTIFILDYISSESARRKVQRELNNGESVNALARALFFGKRGELRERAIQDQLQRNSALNILINAISVYRIRFISLKQLNF